MESWKDDDVVMRAMAWSIFHNDSIKCCKFCNRWVWDEKAGKYMCTGNNCIDGISEYLKKTGGKTEDGEVIEAIVYPGIMENCIGEPAMLEQLAEECAELAKAALKLARIERGENPTPVNKEDAIENLIEEYSDVENCARELSMKPCRDIMDKKLERFVERWLASHKKQI